MAPKKHTINLIGTKHPLRESGPLFADLIIGAYAETLVEFFGDKITPFYDKPTDTEMYVYEQGNKQVFILPGTSSVTDWKMNMRAFPWKLNGLWMHNGFAQGARSMYNAVKNRYDPNKEIWFIGHSLGGAYAEALAISLAKHAAAQAVEANINYMTFGKPNLFHKWEHFESLIWPNKNEPAFLQISAYDLLDNTISVVNPCDPVTFVPKYRFKPFHAQTKIVLPESVVTATGEERTGLVNPPRRELDLTKLLNTLDNHSMLEYKHRVLTTTRLIHF
jgi:hypothetical protein